MIEVSHVEAVDFLKKKDIKPSAELKDGWYFVAHNSTPIGLIKKIGNRSNNYFPKEWRIINDAIQANFSLKDV
jgi:NOL1/NOP2/fmu family ribosome biogenesis protein